MRGKLIGVVLWIVLLGTAFVALRYHVVRTRDAVLLVRKPAFSLEDCLVDVRNWRAPDWQKHAALRKALIEAGHGDVVANSLLDDVRGLFQRAPPRPGGRRGT